MHRGPVGSVALNEALQAALNPQGPSLTRGARTFRSGDKVMQLRNDYERGVWNGDVGTIKSIDPEEETMLVGYDGRDVLYDGAALDELSLAYACSIHKSQGSEYPAVVVTLLTSHFVMLSKNLLYTAITRGRRLVVLVSDPRALALALASDRKDERKTRLAARIAQARATLDSPC
jgi:exodeoxyribonuclease V alpha subunit